MNGRWAMVATFGILYAEFTNPQASEFGYRWFEVGGKPSDTPILPHLAIELAFFAAVENLRLQGYKEGKVRWAESRVAAY